MKSILSQITKIRIIVIYSIVDISTLFLNCFIFR